MGLTELRSKDFPSKSFDSEEWLEKFWIEPPARVRYLCTYTSKHFGIILIPHFLASNQSSSTESPGMFYFYLQLISHAMINSTTISQCLLLARVCVGIIFCWLNIILLTNNVITPGEAIWPNCVATLYSCLPVAAVGLNEQASVHSYIVSHSIPNLFSIFRHRQMCPVSQCMSHSRQL